MQDHDRALSQAFDQQAEQFERAPAQSDTVALAQLVAFAALPHGARVLDAGCGPGLVAETFLTAGYLVHGVDLSAEMVRRACARCAVFGESARFEQGSVADLSCEPFDAAVSRFVVHHVVDADAFVRAQVVRVRPGGVVIVCDHTTDPEPGAAAWHQDLERARDRTHTRNLTTGGLVDLLGRAGLERIRAVEEPFELDLDEWFDRGTPAVAKEEARRRALAGRARGFDPVVREDGGVTVRCVRAMVRGEKAAR